MGTTSLQHLSRFPASRFTLVPTRGQSLYLLSHPIKSEPEHQIQLDTLKGQNPVCKFHASNSHATADCVAFRHAIQDKIDGGLLTG